MRKLEYNFVRLSLVGDNPDDAIIHQLDRLGRLGWDAVGMTADGTHVAVLMKRDKDAARA
jgi:hypothetical protein